MDGYLHHSPGTNRLALEFNQRMLAAETARVAAFVKRLRDLGLSKATAQYLVVRDLFFAPDHQLTQHTIRERRRVSSPNVTRLINGLERDGLVRRLVCSSNKRVTLVQLTQAGEELAEQLIPEIGRFVDDVAQCFSPAELAMFNEFLARLQRHAEALAGVGESSPYARESSALDSTP